MAGCKIDMDYQNVPENKSQKKTTISACLIVKNEQELLSRCLSSLRDVVDEIVMVDTGSDDRTIEIGTEFGCRIFHFPWSGDFSAARNESLRHATGEWIFIIDADEELADESRENLRRAAGRPDNGIISVSVYNKSLETDRVSSFLPSIRLFRRELGLKYHGIVHNRLILPDKAPVMRSDIRLYHYGYDLSHDKLERKKARSLELLQKQLDENPDDIFANFNIAQLLRGLGGSADAETCGHIIEHAERVIRTGKESADAEYFGYRLMAHMQAASALCTVGRYKEAEKHCRKALRLRPDYIDAVMMLANIRLGGEQFQKAEKHYLRYLELVDRYRPEAETDDVILHFLDARQIAWYGLGTIARLKGDNQQALRNFRQIIEHDIDYLDTCYQLGLAYLDRGEYRRAEEMFGREIEINSQSVPAYLGWARAVVEQGRADQAIVRLEKALELEPDNHRILIFFGKTRIKLGQIPKGVNDLKQALEMVSDDPDQIIEIANIFFETGEIEEARKLYHRILKLKSDKYFDALNNLGNCYYRLERFERACSIYEQLIDKNPQYYPAYRNLGMTHIRLGNHKQALEALMAYAEKAPEEIEIYRVIGDLFKDLDYHEEAIGCYEKYLNRHPEDTSCLLNLSEEYFHLGYRESAEMGYRKVLAIDPSCRRAKDRLGLSISHPQGVG
jgi:tetratricopeptide (TPR) repeat protein